MPKSDLNLAIPRSGDVPANPILKARISETMERAYYRRRLEETLRLCKDVTKTFQGSEDTLKYIQRVEECFRRLIAEATQIK